MPLARRWRRRRVFRRKRFVNYKARRWMKGQRLFRRFLRKKSKPELKYNTSQINFNNMVANTNTTSSITPTALQSGTLRSEKIGQQVKFVKVSIRLLVNNDSATTAPEAAPSLQSSLNRIIIWTPRLDMETCQEYMSNLVIPTLLDPNYITVLRDVTFNMSPPYMQEATNNDIAGGPFARQYIKRFEILHPRNVHFPFDSNSIDEEKYGMFITFVNGEFINDMICFARTFYYDA